MPARALPPQHRPQLPRLQLPPSHAVLAVLALAFVAPGLVGHDPWRAFDVIAIEIAHQMHLTGDWVVPRLAGEPWLEDPPFYHWVALAFGKAFGWLFGFHNAARLASGAAMLAALWFLYLAARHTALAAPPPAAGRDPASEVPLRRGTGAAATLLLMGSVGLIVHAHEAVPDLAALAAGCAALFFLVVSDRRTGRAGTAFGASLGVAFLSTGFVVPAVLGGAALAAHLACDDWRSARALRFLGAAAAALAVVAAAWPLALLWRSPELAAAWWQMATSARGGFGDNLRYYLTTATWFAWPAWPLAAWTVWTLRREWRSPRVFVPLAASLAAPVAIAWAGPQQDINAMVLLAPLALLGAHGVARLRRGAANALDWFGVMTFTFFAALVWLGYVAMMTGAPPRIAKNFTRAAPGFAPQFEWLPVLVAAALTLAWLYLAFGAPRAPTRGVTRWAAGVTLLWGSFATLWLPWADHLKSYRSVALQLRSNLPADPGCIAAKELAAPQRAALSYHAGIRTQPLGAASGDNAPPSAASVAAVPSCRYLIVQGHPREEITPGAGWRKLADVGRPGDRGERYRLYRYQPE
jgi:4-amino-4-deoxy-L-arabinose transferase-like glycosyltransferase